MARQLPIFARIKREVTNGVNIWRRTALCRRLRARALPSAAYRSGVSNRRRRLIVAARRRAFSRGIPW